MTHVLFAVGDMAGPPGDNPGSSVTASPTAPPGAC
jgi:hypothetical protein